MTENLIRLKAVHGVGNAILWRLLRQFGGSDGVLGAGHAELTRVKGVSAETAGRILDARTIDPRPEMENAVRAGVDIIPYDDPHYPKPLLHSFDPPVVLYVRGTLTAADQVAVGIVGTRKASGYGRDHAMSMASALARGGFTIVSGLARGIDTFAHMGALNAKGRTVGVLGCGFDHMYPEENRDLALEMTHSGAVISEFPMATGPSRDTFPTRNRIIAGMCLGLLVIEAPLRSGSLITARLANEIGRTVFAIPGRINDTYSEGCNKLIRDGASMVTTVDDIFNELNPSLPLPELPLRPGAKKNGDAAEPQSRREERESAPEQNKPEREKEPATSTRTSSGATTPFPAPELTGEQKSILHLLTDEWQSVDDLTDASSLPAGKVTAALTMLKLTRLAEQDRGQMYRLRKAVR